MIKVAVVTVVLAVCVFYHIQLTNLILNLFLGINNQNCVRVAVYEHVPLGDYDNYTQTPREIINLNVQVYKKAIEMAAKEVSFSL